MNIDKMIEVLTAFKDGKKIQFKDHGIIGWHDTVGDPSWDFCSADYRIKPEPREFYISLGSDGKSAGFNDRPYPDDYPLKVIKVREVIE